MPLGFFPLPLSEPFQYVRPSADSVDGSWTDQAGGTSLFEAIDEAIADDADYIKSGTVPLHDICRIKLAAPQNPVAEPCRIEYRYKTHIATLFVRLMQGNTCIVEWGHYHYLSNHPTDFTLAQQILTTAQFEAITDFSDLYLEFDATTGAILIVPASANLTLSTTAPVVDLAGPTTMTFVDSATAIDGSITIPAGAAAGDFAILFDCNDNNGAISVPSGWTQIGTTLTGDGGDLGSAVYYKVLASGEPGTDVTLATASNEAVMFVYRPDVGINVVVPSVWNEQLTDANPTLQTVSASGQEVPLIVFGMAASNGSVSFTTASPAFDSTLSSSINLIAGRKLYNASPADHSIDMGDAGNGNTLRSGFVRFV